MKAKDVRRTFLEYFRSQGHEVVASSSLIPAEDPTILFANAGMNQFKDCFLGKEFRSYKTATSSQKCVRAGGKHNDLEQVGFTRRHLTFFEMLGNFSFGDYFKHKAIAHGWNLLTKGYGLPADKLYPSVYEKDDEAFAIWRDEIGVPESRIIRLGEKDNFWAMGDTGPCGPCTEIYIDQGESLGCGDVKCAPGCSCDRFLEIWNLVFMQYNKEANGNLVPLSQTGVDTGMGLERLCCVMQGKKSVFDTDIFTAIRTAIEQESGKTYASSDTKTQAAFNVLCDHVRSSSLLIAAGCSPSNDGRGYVLRKIIRRAILFAQKLSDNTALLPYLARAFIADQSDIFPELKVNEGLITSVLAQEVSRFTHNLHSGQHILAKYIDETKAQGGTELSGAHVFKLYDTFGFPFEITKVVAREHGLSIDEDGFAKHMAEQQEQSKHHGHGTAHTEITFPETLQTRFVGYETTSCTSEILWEQTSEHDRWIITKESPFYVESGGQVNDEGVVTINNHSYHVVDLVKAGNRFSPAIAVRLTPVETMGSCTVGDTALCEVNKTARMDTVRNHTATHMLHAALHEILGQQAKQAGSVVNKEYLRFDYTHHEALSADTIRQIEQRVNEKIWDNIPTDISTTNLEEAKRRGVIAFFGEKYNPESVRVVAIPGFSQELCGGTHASATGIIGSFKIVSDTALATGTRRIVAVTGARALALYQQCYRDIKGLSEQFKVKLDEVNEAVNKQTTVLHQTQLALRHAKRKLLELSVHELESLVDHSGTIPTLALILDDADTDALRLACQQLAQKISGFIFLASNDHAHQKSSFIVHVSPAFRTNLPHQDLTAQLQAHALRGGGKDGTIQGGGSIITEDTIAALKRWASAH